MATIEELFEGRTEVVGTRAFAEIPYLVTGAADETEVKIVALASTPTTYAGMLRKSIEVGDRIKDDSWHVTARYEPPEPQEQETPEPVTTFDSTGGTQHITQSIQTLGMYGPGASSLLGGAIGYDGEQVAGVDITVPVWNWSETHYLDDAQVNALAYYFLTGKVNSDSFRGYSPGEVLFLGATGQKRGDAKWEVTFKFAASPNKTGIQVGDITGISKRGWDYMWVQYADDVDDVAKVRIKKPVAVYIEQVYEEGAFSSLGI